MYTNQYYEFIEDKNVPEIFKTALTRFLDDAIKLNPMCIILFGSFGRKMAKEGWSDIDVLLIYNEIDTDLFKVISKSKKETFDSLSIKLDVNILSKSEVTHNQLLSIKYNSKFSTVFSGRDNIALTLYGEIIPITHSLESEKISCVFKVNESIYQFRKSFIDGSYLRLDSNSIKCYIKKLFSTIRASLVIMEHFPQPYEDLVECLKNQFPNYNIVTLEKLIDIRNGDISLEQIDVPELFIEIKDFLEKYVAFVNHIKK